MFVSWISGLLSFKTYSCYPGGDDGILGASRNSKFSPYVFRDLKLIKLPGRLEGPFGGCNVL